MLHLHLRSYIRMRLPQVLLHSQRTLVVFKRSGAWAPVNHADVLLAAGLLGAAGPVVEHDVGGTLLKQMVWGAEQGTCTTTHGNPSHHQSCASRTVCPGQSGKASRYWMCKTPSPSKPKPGARRAKYRRPRVWARAAGPLTSLEAAVAAAGRRYGRARCAPAHVDCFVDLTRRPGPA